MWPSNGGDNQKFRVIHYKNNWVGLQCVANDKCLDVKHASVDDGHDVWLYNRNDTKAQKWKFVRKKGIYNPPEAAPFEIVSALDSNYALDVNEQSTEPGARVQIYKRNGTKAQEWYRLDNGDGT